MYNKRTIATGCFIKQKGFTMNRFSFCLVLFCLAFIFGCGDGSKYGWYKPGATNAQINFDCRECLKKAEIREFVDSYDRYRESELSGMPYIPYEDTELRLDDDDFPRTRRKDYNIGKCMKDKGYRWVRKEF